MQLEWFNSNTTCNDHYSLLLCPQHVTDFNILWATVTMTSTRACSEWRMVVVQSSHTFLDEDNCIVYSVIHELTYTHQEDKTKYLQKKEHIPTWINLTLIRTDIAIQLYTLVAKTKTNTCGNMKRYILKTADIVKCNCRHAEICVSTFFANEAIHTKKPRILTLW